MQKKEALYTGMKKVISKNTAYEVLVVLFVLLIFPVIWLVSPRQHGVRVYDCSIAEISPDYPVSVKEECRKARSEKIK